MKNSSFFLFITFILFGTFLTSLEAMPTTLLEKKGALSDGKTEQENQEEERIFQNQRERMADLTEEDNSSSTLERGSIIDTKEEDPFSTDEENPSLPAQVPSIAVEKKADKELSIISGLKVPHEQLTVVRDFLDTTPLYQGELVALLSQEALKRGANPKLVTEFNSFRNQIQVAYSQQRMLSAHYLVGIALKLKKGIECIRKFATLMGPEENQGRNYSVKSSLLKSMAENALTLAQGGRQQLRADNYAALAMRGKTPHLEKGKNASQWIEDKERYRLAIRLVEDHIEEAIKQMSKESSLRIPSYNLIARGIIEGNQEAFDAYTQAIHEEKLAADYYAQALALFPGEKDDFRRFFKSEQQLKTWKFNYYDPDTSDDGVPQYAVMLCISTAYKKAAMERKQNLEGNENGQYWRPLDINHKAKTDCYHPDLWIEIAECLKYVLEARQQDSFIKYEKYYYLALKSYGLQELMRDGLFEYAIEDRQEVLEGLADSEWIGAGTWRNQGNSE